MLMANQRGSTTLSRSSPRPAHNIRQLKLSVSSVNFAVGAPLSAISFCADGHTIGVGTVQSGQVIIYDLKDSKRIKLELKGHDRSSRVKAIQFSRL